LINIYNEKSTAYFSNTRKDLLSFIDKNYLGLTILEIGAGSGETLLELKKTGIANKIYGYDLVDICLNKSEFESFIVGNIEKDPIPFNEKFDIIILADVLEHLVEPEKVLEKLIPFLKKNGKIYISLPNIRNYKAMYNIFFKGDFKYEEEGVLDQTHLRFFCKKNMKALITKIDGLQLVETVSNLKHTKSKISTINNLTFGLFEGFFSLQYFMKVAKK
jgi:2-polyprenyl-3-methyl-5-hydroxy-6-metoxy-1,4-benzoquinol methylase